MITKFKIIHILQSYRNKIKIELDKRLKFYKKSYL